MIHRFFFRPTIASAALAAMLVCTGSPHAQAGDFFSALFGGFAPPRMAPPAEPLSFAPVNGGAIGPDHSGIEAPARVPSGPVTAYCVRTCDGRYFPLSHVSGQSHAAACHSFCPASETKVFVGQGIDRASASDTGRPYAAMPNAYRYRKELVAGCTCNGRIGGGLAHIKIEDDPTLRKGDLVADAKGDLVASGGRDRRTAYYGPAPSAPHHVPLIAAQ